MALTPSARSAAITPFRKPAETWGTYPLVIWLVTWQRVTFRTSRERFSIPQWPRFQANIVAASAVVGGTLVNDVGDIALLLVPAGPPTLGAADLGDAGGTRVPLIVRWPAKIKPGVSSALISQVDLLPTLAKLVGEPAANEPIDGQDVLPALLGQSSTAREVFIEQGAEGLAVRKGKWKFIPSGASRGQPNNEIDAARSMYLGKTTKDAIKFTLATSRHLTKKWFLCMWPSQLIYCGFPCL